MEDDMNRLLTITIVMILAAAAALAQNVKVDFDKERDFSQYRTYAWKDSGGASEQAVETSFTARRIREAVNRELTAKGMTEVTENPDLHLLCTTDSRERTQVHSTGIYPHGGFGRRAHWGWGGGWSTARTYHYDEGQMVIMLVDADTGELVWRAVANARISHTQKDAKRIDKAARRAFKKFPPKVKGAPAAPVAAD
jgi:hypothetical protein